MQRESNQYIPLIRRITICADHVVPKHLAENKVKVKQFDLFSDAEAIEKQEEQNAINEKKEEDLAKAILRIKQRFGKNMVLKGTNFEEGATGKSRNEQIGGHKE